MEYETACDRICHNIATLLIEAGRPTPRAAFAAASATREIADALHHAAGLPDDARWHRAFDSLETFVNIYDVAARGVAPNARSGALAELRGFLAENAA